MRQENKYARTEWERRFLLKHFPHGVSVTRVRRIVDRYITGTSLRLREQSEGGQRTFKLTQKLRGAAAGAEQGLITTIYLTKGEFCVLANLPAKILTKTRHSVPPFGIDAFEGGLSGLVLAEAEFGSRAEASALAIPSFVVNEITDDARFTGGNLVGISKQDLEACLADYGVTLLS